MPRRSCSGDHKCFLHDLNKNKKIKKPRSHHPSCRLLASIDGNPDSISASPEHPIHKAQRRTAAPERGEGDMMSTAGLAKEDNVS